MKKSILMIVMIAIGIS